MINYKNINICTNDFYNDYDNVKYENNFNFEIFNINFRKSIIDNDYNFQISNLKLFKQFLKSEPNIDYDDLIFSLFPYIITLSMSGNENLIILILKILYLVSSKKLSNLTQYYDFCLNYVHSNSNKIIKYSFYCIKNLCNQSYDLIHYSFSKLPINELIFNYIYNERIDFKTKLAVYDILIYYVHSNPPHSTYPMTFIMIMII